MTAFVLGATGFVGREVVRQLCVRGASVVAHVRPDSRALADWQARFTALGATVDTTPWDQGALTDRLRALAPSQLYLLIGTTRARAKAEAVPGNIYEAIDLGLTATAVAAARASSAAPRLVYLSSIGADPAARSPYLAARGKAEAAVTGAGLPWVIARPSFIIGERDERRLGERASAVVGDALLAVAWLFGARRLRDRYRSTCADVLASALIRLAESPDHDRIVDGSGLR